MCFGCSKEPSHRDGSFEYPKHMFWLRNEKKISHVFLSGGLSRTNVYELDCFPNDESLDPLLQ